MDDLWFTIFGIKIYSWDFAYIGGALYWGLRQKTPGKKFLVFWGCLGGFYLAIYVIAHIVETLQKLF